MEANRKHDAAASDGAEISAEIQDKSRKRKKRAKAVLSFVIMALLLLVLFFASVNIGSLKVSFGELLQGLFGNAGENAATVFDLRFPRILISMLAGAATAVSGVLFQSVLKNPLADPGIIGISSGASFAAVVITAFVPSLFFFTPLFAFLGGVLAFFLVYSLSWRGGLSPLRIILVGVAVNAMFTGLSSAPELHDRREFLRCGIHRQRQHYHEDLGRCVDPLALCGGGASAGPVFRGEMQPDVPGGQDGQKPGR